MTTRKAMDEFIHDVEQKLSNAQEMLNQANRNQFENDAEYSLAQQELAKLESEIEHWKLSANSQQKEQLYRLHLLVSNVMNDMVLDQIKMDDQ